MSKAVPENRLLAYGAYTQIAESLQHYNRVQAIYRSFVSTWLIATFIGIGYSLSSFEINLPFHPLLTIAFICTASTMGISLVWYMDLIVCEQQIAASVFEGIELEKMHPWLPRFYNNIKDMRGLISYVNLKNIFYIGCFTILITTAGASITIYFNLKHPEYVILVPLVTISLVVLSSVLLIASTKRTDPYYRLQKLKGKHIGK